MNDKEIKVITDVDVITYSAAIKDIVEDFFDENGEYTPHFGRMGAVGTFFNYFVDEESLKEYFSDVEEGVDLDFILGNGECMRLYNDALSNADYYRLDFSNAYKDAMEIVRTKSSAASNIANKAKEIMYALAGIIDEVFTEENAEKLIQAFDEMTKKNTKTESTIKSIGDALK